LRGDDMKVLLFTTPWDFSKMTNPFFSTKDRLGFIRKIFKVEGQGIMGSFPPLGLMYLSAALKRAGHEARILNGMFATEEEIFREMETGGYGLFGISTYSAGWRDDQLMIEKTKKRFPGTGIVIGGPHANGWKTNCFKDSPFIDYMVYGDGENALLGLVERLGGNKPLDGINGLAWKDAGTSKVVDNGGPDYIMNIDDIPFPDWDGVDIYRYRPTLTNYKRLPAIDIIGSRGCPFRCIFCHSSCVVRKRSVKSIMDEIDILVKRYGIKDMTFYDETFTMFRDRNLQLCDELIRRKYDLVWAANARADCLDEEMLKKMKAAGCWRLLFGIESGSQRVLDIMKKGITLEQTRNAVKMTKEAGIEAHGTMIFGIPGETYEEGLETIKFACDLDLDYAAFSSLALFPGTEVFNMVSGDEEFDFEDHSALKVGYVPDSMTRRQLEDLLDKSYKKFYFRPSYIVKRISRIRSMEDVKRNMIGLLAFMRGE